MSSRERLHAVADFIIYTKNILKDLYDKLYDFNTLFDYTIRSNSSRTYTNKYEPENVCLVAMLQILHRAHQ